MAKKKSVPKKRYFRDIKKKKHEAGWLALLKIGVVAFIIFVILSLAFGYSKTLSIPRILLSGLQVAILVIVLIVFIVGLINVSENTASELKRK